MSNEKSPIRELLDKKIAEIEKLKEENKKLRDALYWYSKPRYGIFEKSSERARSVLEEHGE